MEQLNTLPITDAEDQALSVHKGGTAASTAEEAAENLNLITYNNPQIVKLNVQGKLITDQFSNIDFGSTVSIKGPNQLYVGTITEFEITDYDHLRFYEIFPNNCIVERVKDKIFVKTYSVPMECSFEINKRIYKFNVVHSPVNKPVIAYPSNGTTELDSILTFQTNSFSMASSYDEHVNSDWQLAVDISFTNIVKETSYDPNHRLEWSVSELVENTTYYLRVRHRSIFSGSSEWSNTCIFVTKTKYKPAPPVLENPEPSSNNVNLKATFIFSDFKVIGKANDRHIKTDWQLAIDSNFATIIDSSLDDAENLNSWHVEGLNDLRTYYIRARYTGVNYGQGDWSPAYSFTTIVSNTVSTPVISSPVRNSSGNPLDLTIKSTAFNVSDGSDIHINSDWQLALDSAFINIAQQSMNSSANKLTWTPATLLPNKNYFLRVRYRGQIMGESQWSTPITFKTIGVDRPFIITPVNNAQDQILNIQIKSSEFSATGTDDDHSTSDWQLASDSLFTSILQSLIDDDVNLTSWNVSLNLNTTYYIRVRHNGAIYGKGDWSSPIKFSTIPKYIVLPPRIISPESGINNQPSVVRLTASDFLVNDYVDTHTVSHWELSKNDNFTDIVQSAIDDAVNLKTWVVNGLLANTTYYVRVRYKGASNGYSAWSLVSNFKTVASYNPAKPKIVYPLNKANNMNLSDLIESSDFEMVGGNDIHVASDWQIATDAGFNNIVVSQVNSSLYLQLLTYSGLTDFTRYYVRTRYKSEIYGYGPWSDAVEFSTIIKNSISTPAITSPVNNSIGNQASLTILSSPFSTSGGTDTHASSDWQIAKDINFTNIIETVINDTSNKLKYTASQLVSSTIYYVRVRYKGTVLPVSAWSPVIAFTTIGVIKPSITNPVNGAGDIFPSLILRSSTFATSAGTDTHKYSDWVVSTDPTFATYSVSTSNNTQDKTTWAAPLNINTTYYVRVRYCGNSYGLSPWSDTIKFTTVKNYSVKTPLITSPTNNSQGLRDTFEITSSAFDTNGGSDYHLSTDWQVATDTSFINVVKSSLGNTNNLTSWTVDGLAPSTIYYIRVKHTGSNYGSSNWSSHIMFSTKATFEPTKEEANFYAGDRGYNNHFGAVVAMSGDGQRVAVTDPSNYAVYIFRKSGSSWIQETKLSDPSTNGYSGHGASLALNYDGDHLIAGAPYFSAEGLSSVGTVYPYIRSNYSWSLDGSINAFRGGFTGFEKFGASVAVNSLGNVAVIGMPNYKKDDLTVGAVYIFNRTATNWIEVYRLYASDRQQNDGFGDSVSISSDGQFIAVGASTATRFGAYSCGQVYIFKNMLESWNQEAIIPTGDIITNNYFGISLKIDGTGQRVVIGSRSDKAYIYGRNSGAWSLELRIAKGRSFGRNVSISNDGKRVIIGEADYTVENVYTSLGAISVHSKVNTGWTTGSQALPSFKKSGLQFGCSVDISGNGAIAVVGAYEMNIGGIGMVGGGGPAASSGQVFIFS